MRQASRDNERRLVARVQAADENGFVEVDSVPKRGSGTPNPSACGSAHRCSKARGASRLAFEIRTRCAALRPVASCRSRVRLESHPEWKRGLQQPSKTQGRVGGDAPLSRARSCSGCCRSPAPKDEPSDPGVHDDCGLRRRSHSRSPDSLAINHVSMQVADSAGTRDLYAGAPPASFTPRVPTCRALWYLSLFVRVRVDVEDRR